MSLVDIKCPNCGASIQLDSIREEGYCSYCGSKVQVQEAIYRFRIDKSGDIQDYFNLAKTSIDANNGQEAYSYANKTLELDSRNADAWYIKMKALGLMAILKELRCSEVITAGRKAIEFDNSSEMKNNVYSYFLFKCLNDLQFCMAQLQNVDAIKELYEANCAVNLFKATEKTLASDIIVNLIFAQESDILGLRLAIPDSEITNNNGLALQTVEVAKQWVYYQNAINDRFNVYGTSINDAALERYKQNLNRIKDGLPEDYQSVIDERSLTNEKKNGCYIATAVYGSYTAPEVIVLRHFRDYSLRKSNFGRLFIKAYYFFSPSIANKLKNAASINRVVRLILDKWIGYLKDKY